MSTNQQTFDSKDAAPSGELPAPDATVPLPSHTGDVDMPGGARTTERPVSERIQSNQSLTNIVTEKEDAVPESDAGGVQQQTSAAAAPSPLPSIATTTAVANVAPPTPIGPPAVSQADLNEKSPHGRYVRLDVRLGAGAYKDVWRAYDTIEGIEVAWNVVKLSRIPPSERKRIKTEVKLLKDIEHKNIIKYHNSWVDREKHQIVFITEIMSSGSLKEYLRKNPMIRWNAVKRWSLQILDGLAFLHSKHIIHRDIKCDNIFINGSTGDLRIGDLGLSTRIAEAQAREEGPEEGAQGSGNAETKATHLASLSSARQITASTMTCLGTPEFMAPELYDESYDERVDIYAFGMACLEMITALTPYHECTSAPQIYKKVVNGEMPPELSRVSNNNARAFIEACLRPQSSRPSASQLMEHIFLQPNEAEDFNLVRASLNKPVLSGWEEGREEEEDEESEPEAEADADTDTQRSVSGDGNIPPADSDMFEPKSPMQRDKMLSMLDSEAEAVRLSADFEAGDGHRTAQKTTESPVSVQQHSHKLSLDSNGRADLPLVNRGDVIDDVRLSSDLDGTGRKPERLMDVESIEQVNTSTLDEVGNAPSGLELQSQDSQNNGTSKDGSSFRSRIRRVQTRSGSITGTDVAGLVLPDAAVSISPIPAETSSAAATNATAASKPQLVGADRVVSPLENVSRIPSEAGSECLETSTILASLRNPVAVVDLSDIPGSTKSLLFKITLPDVVEGVYKEVEFEFDLVQDDILVLVDEMQADPDLAASIAESGSLLVEAMAPVVDKARRALADRERAGVVSFDLADAVFRRVIEDVRELTEQGNHSALDVLLPLYNTGLRKSDEILQGDSTVSIDNTGYNSEGAADDFVSDAEVESALNADAEFVDLRQKLIESLSRVERERTNRMAELNSQREKVDEAYRKDRDKWMARRTDLNDQLEAMHAKLRERMHEFDLQRRDLVQQYRAKHATTLTTSLSAVVTTATAPVASSTAPLVVISLPEMSGVGSDTDQRSPVAASGQSSPSQGDLPTAAT